MEEEASERRRTWITDRSDGYLLGKDFPRNKNATDPRDLGYRCQLAAGQGYHINTLTATPKSYVSLRTPREYFYYSKYIMAK